MSKLKVYYGWSRIGNVRKKRALSVMFENENVRERNTGLPKRPWTKMFADNTRHRI